MLEPLMAAAQKASMNGPASIPMIDEAVLELSKGYSFVPQKGATALMEGMGHHMDSGLLGIIAASDLDAEGKPQKDGD